MLAEFGIGPGEESVYRALLRSPDATATQVAAALDVPPDEVAAAIDALVALGLAVVGQGHHSVHVLPPDQAVSRLVEREERLLEERRQRIRRNLDAVPELVDDYVGNRRQFVSDQVELLTESAHVRSRLFQLTSQARTSAWAIHLGPALDPGGIAAARPLDAALAQRGIDCRMIVERSSLGPAHWTAYLNELADLGHAVRVATAVSQRCIIVDSHTAVVPSSAVERPGAYVLNGTSLVAPVVALFEEVWSRAEVVAMDADDDHAVTEARIRTVAALLARGLKDETVARRLGVSVRTVRRLIAATMDALGADSRFQAGVLAARNGWLDTE
jgi:DNA-binding CsgD family transcriptional regulator